MNICLPVDLHSGNDVDGSGHYDSLEHAIDAARGLGRHAIVQDINMGNRYYAFRAGSYDELLRAAAQMIVDGNISHTYVTLFF